MASEVVGPLCFRDCLQLAGLYASICREKPREISFEDLEELPAVVPSASDGGLAPSSAPLSATSLDRRTTSCVDACRAASVADAAGGPSPPPLSSLEHLSLKPVTGRRRALFAETDGVAAALSRDCFRLALTDGLALTAPSDGTAGEDGSYDNARAAALASVAEELLSLKPVTGRRW